MKKLAILVLVLISIFSIVLYNVQTPTPIPNHPTDTNADTVKFINFKAQYVRTDVEYTPKTPYTEVINSKEQLRDYIRRFAVNTTGTTDGSISFQDAIQKYTDNYFVRKQLVICMLEEPSGSIRHNIETVGILNDKDLFISINRDIPEWCTDDMALWHIFIETDVTDITYDNIKIIVDSKKGNEYTGTPQNRDFYGVFYRSL